MQTLHPLELSCRIDRAVRAPKLPMQVPVLYQKLPLTPQNSAASGIVRSPYLHSYGT